jgi:hypothetical protein
MTALRAIRRPPRAVLLTLSLGLVVGAIVIGLVGMHTLSIDAPHHAPAAAVAAEHHPGPPEGIQVVSPAPDECASTGCQPVHAIGLAMCVLALLVLSLVVGVAPPRSGRWMMITLATRSLEPRLRAVDPDPPSLVALSISRT